LPYILFVGAVVSAILSTVASALLAAAAITSHNLVAPFRPDLSDRARLRTARIAVVVAGALAWLLARHAESIYALVEQSSAFGGAGIFVVVMFGLFTRFGGAPAALAAMLTGIAVWLTGHLVPDWPHPYLSSLAAAAVTYIVVSTLPARSAPRLHSLR
jgi:Na+/proline symporter